MRCGDYHHGGSFHSRCATPFMRGILFGQAPPQKLCAAGLQGKSIPRGRVVAVAEKWFPNDIRRSGRITHHSEKVQPGRRRFQALTG